MGNDLERRDSESGSEPATPTPEVTSSVRVKLVNPPMIYGGLKALLVAKGGRFTRESIRFDHDDRDVVHVVWNAVGATREELIRALQTLKYSGDVPVRFE